MNRNLEILAVAVLATCFWAQPGLGQVANGTYKVVARHSGQCLAPLGGSSANQTALVTQPYDKNTNKHWTLTSIGSGQYKMMGVASGRYINVYNSSTADDAPIRLYSWADQTNFKFTLTDAGNGYYRLTFVHSGKAMGVLNSMMGLDSPIVQRSYAASAANAQWKFLPPTDGQNAGAPFSMVVLPDTQKYCGSALGGTPQMFYDQTDWIGAQRANRNIVYVCGEGDIVDNGMKVEQWKIARQAMYVLDDVVPYGLVPGNHDFDQNEHTSMINYESSFGIQKFISKSYYGGHYGDNNESHYDYFSASGKNFIVIHMTWRDADRLDQDIMNWVNDVIRANPDRRAIVVSHELIYDTSGGWKPVGLQLYNTIKGNPNLFLMLCGHVGLEGRRMDLKPDGSPLWTIEANYQGDVNGGNGKLREMQFVPSENLIIVRTYSPTVNTWYNSESSCFTIPCDLQRTDGVDEHPFLNTRQPYFLLVNRATGKALDLTGGSTENGGLVSQWTYNYNYAPNERWIVEATGRGNFRIVSTVSKKVVCVAADSLNAGAQIHQWDYIDRPSHQWDLVDAGNGWFKIRNEASGHVIEVANSSTADGARVQQNLDVNGNNQMWRLQPWGDYYVRASAGAANKYVCAKDGGTANGTPIVQYTGQSNAWFRWRFEGAGEGLLKVSSVNYPTSAISLVYNSTSNGTIAHLWNYVGSPEQKVRIVPQLDSTYSVLFANSGLYWDIKGNLPGNDVTLQQYVGNGSPAQAFVLQRVP